MYTNQIYMWYKYSVDLRIPSSFDFDGFFFFSEQLGLTWKFLGLGLEF